MDTSKQFCDSRQIAGYLRDAIFNRYVFQLSNNGVTAEATLRTIEEKSARDKTPERALIFSRYSNGSDVNQADFCAGDFVTVSVALDRFRLFFETKVTSVDSHTLVAELPSSAMATVARKQYRFKASYLSPKTCRVSLIDSENRKYFGLFELEDISSDGLGGRLSVWCKELPKGLLRIQGCLNQETGVLRIDGVINRYVREESKSLESAFRIGIRNWDEVRTRKEIKLERRSRKRLRATFPIEIVSPLFPNSAAVLQLEDLSLGGLKAQLINIADKALFRRGLEVMAIEPKLRLRVHRLDDRSVTFIILRSALEEHIKLFNQQSLLSNRDLASGTPIGSDAVQVYTTSGALSSSMASHISHQKEYLTPSTFRQSHHVPWNLRWLQQAEDGRIRASFLSAPYADHIWYVGGLAGHIDPELKMSRDFVSRYFVGMAAFFEGLGTQEHFLINWFKDNSWWDDWDQWLNKQSKADVIRFEGDIAYLNSFSTLPRTVEGISAMRRVDRPANLSNRAHDTGLKNLEGMLVSLGFGTNGAGYAATSELLERAGHRFERRFYAVDFNGKKVTAMFSSFPGNVFLNGIINYPFVVSSTQLTAMEIDQLAFRLTEIAIEIGVDMPAFFYSVDGNCSEVRASNCLKLREVIWTYGSVDSLKYWESL